ncbi:MAG: G-D-S-L family lipolytic protein [Psychroserpens sp.]|uniref:G-D-S-L family lipolytic protein n=1 Tax=Psychroserpens sp. TaxID=2020870 RepID=UPI0030027268
MKTIKYILLSAILIGFTACNDEEDFDRSEAEVVLPELTVGSLDLSNYVAVGASFTAGFTDNALFIAAQENSFPNQLATQFAKAGSGSFSQPLMSDNTGGLLFNGMPAPDGSFGPRLFLNDAGPAVLPGMSTTEATNNLGGTFNNVGVPGAKSFHVPFEGYGALNPYFGRMASSPTASMLGDALAQSPTFFTLSEIGGNDVLGYATSGGIGVDQTGNINPLTYGNNDITDPNVFAQSFTVMVTALTANGAKGVVTTVPDITSLSHFTTVPHDPFDPNNPTTGPALVAQIPTLNQIYGALNQIFAVVDPSRIITFSTTETNPAVMKDENLADLSAVIAGTLGPDPAFAAFIGQFGLPPQAAPLVAGFLGATYGQARQTTENDLLVLPSSSILGQVNEDVATALAALLPPAVAGQFSVEGITLPLEDKWVLTPQEQASIAAATAAYNSTIQTVADANPDVAVADLRAVLEQAATTGYPYDDYTMTTDLVFGGLVSLDGVHLTARGYGLMAREFLVAMDAAFGSNFIASGSTPAAGPLPTNYGPTL